MEWTRLEWAPICVAGQLKTLRLGACGAHKDPYLSSVKIQWHLSMYIPTVGINNLVCLCMEVCPTGAYLSGQPHVCIGLLDALGHSAHPEAWFKFASIPLVSVIFTWWHVWLGIKMCFYPVEFVGGAAITCQSEELRSAALLGRFGE